MVVVDRNRLEKIILERLAQRQGELDLNKSQFAQYLGVDRNLYTQALRLHKSEGDGKGKHIGPTLAGAALQKFPDLHDLIMSFLLSYNDRSSTVRMRTRGRVRTKSNDVRTETVDV